MKLLALPTWAIMRIAVKIPFTNHVWKNRRFSLLEWYTGRKPLTEMFDIVLWFSGGNLILIIIILGT